MLEGTGDPGAIGLAVLAAIGLFVAVLGSRYFRVTAAVTGFLIGTELLGRLVYARGVSDLTGAIVGAGGGVALAAAFVLCRPAGLVALGSALAASLAVMACEVIGAPDHYWAYLPAAVAGGLGSLFLSGLVTMVSTAFFGAVGATACGFALWTGRTCASVAEGLAPQGMFYTGAYNRIYFLGAASILVVTALVLQNRLSGSLRFADT
jgi:hypothetical protein